MTRGGKMTGINYLAEIMVHLSAMIEDKAKLGDFIVEFSNILEQYIELGESWENTVTEIKFQLQGIAKANAFAAHFSIFEVALLRLWRLK
ncbi:MAG: hypothetical protein ACKKL6_02010 [Candidatus Komeilibacteria bacterium]